MPAAAYQFQVLQGAIDALKAAGDPKGDLMEKHERFSHLGALGPDLFKYLYIDDPGLNKVVTDVLAGTVDPNSLDTVEQLSLHRRLLMVAYKTVYGRFTELWPVLEKLHAFFDKMDSVISSEDSDALQDLQPEAEAIQSQLDPLTNVGSAGSAVYDAIAQLISLFRPMIQADSATANALQTQPVTWRQAEFLNGRGSGRLTRRLVELAQAETNAEQRDQKLAFAYGWMSHVAGAVTGEPFVNNIVGGPYRTHWWRNRFIQNYVDTWAYGYYHTAGASMSGDSPSPDYNSWANLCGAKLHDRIRFDGSPEGLDAMQAVIDGEALEEPLPYYITKMLAQAIEDVYAGELTPLPPGSLDPEVINNAYVGAVSALFFMTGGKPIICTSPPGAAPSTCTTPPDWVTSGGSPPATDPDDFVDDSQKASKVILAILAILFFLGGAILEGIGALLASMAIDPVKWDELRCHIYWLRYFLFQAEKAIRDMLVWGTLIYPTPEDLATAVAGGPPDGVVAAAAYCRTRTDRARYPYQMSTDEAGQFTSYPTTPVELNPTRSWHNGGEYPVTAIDDPANAPVAGDMTSNDPANFPAKQAAGDTAWFGNSVRNAVAIIQSEGEGLVDYNLDADRGYGWMAWKHPVGDFPSDPPFGTDPA